MNSRSFLIAQCVKSVGLLNSGRSIAVCVHNTAATLFVPAEARRLQQIPRGKGRDRVQVTDYRVGVHRKMTANLCQ